MRTSKILFCFNLLLVINLSIAFLHNVFLFEAKTNNLLQFNQLLHGIIERKLASMQPSGESDQDQELKTESLSLDIFKLQELKEEVLEEAKESYLLLIKSGGFDPNYSMRIERESILTRESICKVEERRGIGLNRKQRYMVQRVIECALFAVGEFIMKGSMASESTSGTSAEGGEATLGTPDEGREATPGTSAEGGEATLGTPDEGGEATPGTSAEGGEATPGTSAEGGETTPGTSAEGRIPGAPTILDDEGLFGMELATIIYLYKYYMGGNKEEVFEQAIRKAEELNNIKLTYIQRSMIKNFCIRVLSIG